jgi:hypothetical protein
MGFPTPASPIWLAKPPDRIIRPQLGADYPAPDYPVFTRIIRSAETETLKFQELTCVLLER